MGTASLRHQFPPRSRRSLRHQFHARAALPTMHSIPMAMRVTAMTDRGGERIPRRLRTFQYSEYRRHSFRDVRQARRFPGTIDVGRRQWLRMKIFTTPASTSGTSSMARGSTRPWGVVWTTRDFGEFSNAILVGISASGASPPSTGFTYKSWLREES